MARRRRTLPLRLRLPNPPALFVGRGDEQDWLADAVERLGVVLVRGPVGIGKTALVLQTLATHHAAKAKQTLYISLSIDEPADQVRLTLAHALAKAAGEELDIAGLRGDPEELVALALDLAEEHKYWVVIDDLHRSESGEMAELVRQLAAYARESRWLITTCALTTMTELEGQTIDLGPLAVGDMAALALSLEPDKEAGELQGAINASSGSPWLLRQYLTSGEESLVESRAAVLKAMSESALELMQTLALLSMPFDKDALSGFVQWPGDDEVAALCTRGLLAEQPEGYTLSEYIRDFLFGGSTSTDVPFRRMLADALAQTEDPRALLESLRLRRQMGDVDGIVALLNSQGHDLMALGFAPRVWAVVGEETDRRLGLWQLRCAAELGNSTVLAAVRKPRLTGESDQLAWAATQYLLGEPEEAHRLALLIRAEASDPTRRADASLLAARSALHFRTPQESLAELENLSTDARHFERKCFTALAHSCVDADGAALQAATLLREAPSETEPEALLDLATAFYRCDDRERAREIAGRVLATPRGGRPSLLVGRRALLLSARVALDGGHFADAGRLLELVRPYARGVSILRPLVIELDAQRRLVVGEFSGLRRSLETGSQFATRADQGVTQRIQRLLLEVQAAEGVLESRASVAEETPVAASPWETRSMQRIEALLDKGRRALTSALDVAIEDLREALRLATRHSLPHQEARTLLSLGDALLAASRRDALADVIARLEELGDLLGALRLRAAASFLHGFGSAPTLQKLCVEPHIAPAMSRRAKALLGADVLLSAEDKLVLAAAAAAWSDRKIELILGAVDDWDHAWGMDMDAKEVWLTDGRVVELRKKSLSWKILTSIARRGCASKEDLILDAWDESEYHPLRHDPKLHVAIRALRALLEDDPSSPARLVTNEDGYRLGGAVRQVRRLA